MHIIRKKTGFDTSDVWENTIKCFQMYVNISLVAGEGFGPREGAIAFLFLIEENTC